MSKAESKERFSFRCAVYLILQKDNKILLMRRFNTGWKDGMYTLPAGHVDGNETIADSMTREALEETGVLVKSEDLSVVHTVHQIGDKEYIDFYLQANKWNGDPSILEPDKCDDIQWFSLNELPDKLLPNVKDVLKQLENGQTFSEFKWK